MKLPLLVETDDFHDDVYEKSVKDADGHPIAIVTAIYGTDGEANAAFIVQACNAHDDLVDALRMARTVLEGAIHPSCRKPGDSIDKIAAALAKAGAA